MDIKKIDNLLTEGVAFKNQSPDVRLALIVNNQIARARESGIGMHILENADFTPDCLRAVRLCPDWRPILHQSMVTEFHDPE